MATTRTSAPASPRAGAAAADAGPARLGTARGHFDHGEEGYGLWLDPAIQDNPIYAEHWAGHRQVEVTVEEDRIVIRRTGRRLAALPLCGDQPPAGVVDRLAQVAREGCVHDDRRIPRPWVLRGDFHRELQAPRGAPAVELGQFLGGEAPAEPFAQLDNERVDDPLQQCECSGVVWERRRSPSLH